MRESLTSLFSKKRKKRWPSRIVCSVHIRKKIVENRTEIYLEAEAEVFLLLRKTKVSCMESEIDRGDCFVFQCYTMSLYCLRIIVEEDRIESKNDVRAVLYTIVMYSASAKGCTKPGCRVQTIVYSRDRDFPPIPRRHHVFPPCQSVTRGFPAV